MGQLRLKSFVSCVHLRCDHYTCLESLTSAINILQRPAKPRVVRGASFAYGDTVLPLGIWFPKTWRALLRIFHKYSEVVVGIQSGGAFDGTSQVTSVDS